MFGSTILDVAVGLILIYLILSLISSAIQEYVAGILRARANTLVDGMKELLQDEQLMKDLYAHPLINGLYRGSSFDEAVTLKSLPSYIPSSAFSLALLDLVVKGRDHQSAIQAGPEARVVTIDSIRSQITRLGNDRVQRAVLSALDAAQGDLATAQANIEQWFNNAMDRVSGWYKKKTQMWVFVIGLSLVIFADVDTIAIARRLYTDPAQRSAVVAIAGGITAKDTVEGSNAAKLTADKLKGLGLPLAWENVHVAAFPPTSDEMIVIGKHTWKALFGWLLTAFAISLGASFWFDALSKIMMIRGAMKPPTPTNDGASNGPKSVAPVTAAASVTVTNRPSQASAAVTPGALSSAPPPADFHPQAWESGHPEAGII